jgi:hypothetical protein
MTEQVVVAKPWYKSSTLWLNIAAIAALGLQYVTNTNLLDPEFQALVLALLNLLNRFRTSSPVKI